MKLDKTVTAHFGDFWKTHINALSVEAAIVSAVVELLRDGESVLHATIITEAGLEIRFAEPTAWVAPKVNLEYPGQVKVGEKDDDR